MLSISLLVLLHEGGHFFFARLFGVWVEKFYLFFDVKLGKWDGSIVKTKADKLVEGKTTQYGIGWLPLGGYCKIAGMIDESFDTEQMKQPAKSWEFRTKPAWQRLLIMTGGVMVNFLLALFIYSMVLFTWGDQYFKVSDMTEGMKFNSEAKALGFHDHDVLIGTEQGDFKDFSADLFRDLAVAHQVRLVRQGQQMTLSLPGNLNLLDMLKSDPTFCRPFIPAVIDSIMPGTEAERLHLAKGDTVKAIGGKTIDSWNEYTYQTGILSDMLAAATTADDSLQIRSTHIVVARATQGVTDTLAVTLDKELHLGVVQLPLYKLYQPTKVEYGFLESFPAGISYGLNVLGGYVGDLKYLFSADGAKSLGGFGAIGSLFPPVWDWHMFWLMTAFLSIILAFMNILPIPALDGGHVLFLIYEMLTGRKPSEKFMIGAEYVGFGIVILLMVVANLNDILRWLGYM